MRILLVTEDLPLPNPGGAGKHAVLLGNALIEAGHEVELLGRLRTADVVGNNDFAGEMHCQINLARTGWKEDRLGAFLPGKREHIGRRIWGAVRALGMDRYDVIHYHGHYSTVGALAPASVNFIQTLHDQGGECIIKLRFKLGAPCSAKSAHACASCATPFPNVLQTLVSAYTVRRLRNSSTTAFARHKTIFVSDFLERRFREITTPAVKLRSHVVHNFTNAVRMIELLDQTSCNSTITKPVALIVGRLDAGKGIPAFLDEVTDRLLARYHWRVLGDGPMRHELEKIGQSRGIEIGGYLPQDQIYAETLAATICVVPSIWEEPCGTTILEALAIGKPVFALSRGGTPELARYERYPGQLALASSMDALVEMLDIYRADRAPMLSGVDTSADVRLRLPTILDIYREPVA